MTPLAEFLFKALVLAGLGLVWGWACIQFKRLVEAQDAQQDDEARCERAWRELRDRLAAQTTTWPARGPR